VEFKRLLPFIDDLLLSFSAFSHGWVFFCLVKLQYIPNIKKSMLTSFKTLKCLSYKAQTHCTQTTSFYFVQYCFVVGYPTFLVLKNVKNLFKVLHWHAKPVLTYCLNELMLIERARVILIKDSETFFDAHHSPCPLLDHSLP
jgi:hypothetical protein